MTPALSIFRSGAHSAIVALGLAAGFLLVDSAGAQVVSRPVTILVDPPATGLRPATILVDPPTIGVRVATVLIENHPVALRIPTVFRPCGGDWNGDMAVNSADFFDFLTCFFQEDADYNLDGFTNSQDFFDFLAAFFAGC